MTEVTKKQDILIQWLSWHFFEAPASILKAWKNFLLFNLNYFSVPLLLKTYLSPWRKYTVSYSRGFDFARYAEALLSNAIFRILGAIIRTFLIVIGLIFEILILIAGTIVFFSWLFLPFITAGAFIFGIKVLF